MDSLSAILPNHKKSQNSLYYLNLDAAGIVQD